MKRFLLGGGTIGALTIAVAMLTPNAARGVTAALVQVANTASAPIPIFNVEQPARLYYGRTFLGTSVSHFGGTCQVTSPDLVPAGKTMVVEMISATVDTDHSVRPNMQIEISGYPQSWNTVLEMNPPLTFQGSFGTTTDRYTAILPVKIYIPQNSAMDANICPFVNGGNIQGLLFTVNGYMINN